jgi:hypothetical protein
LSSDADAPSPASSSVVELDFTLEDLDRDGAIAERIAHLYGESRAGFLRKAAFGSAALLAGLAAPPAFGASPKQDVSTLNFDLVFEFMQSSFYLGAVRDGTVAAMRPEKERWARVLGAHELAHVTILKSVLGEKAVAKPFFNFRGITESEAAFTRTAVAMEDLTVALLAGQAPTFHNRKLVSAVFALLTTEARHAAWARRIGGFVPVADAFDEPKTLAEVGRAVRATRFIAARPRTRSGRSPKLTG